MVAPRLLVSQVSEQRPQLDVADTRGESTNHGNIYRKPDVLPPTSSSDAHQHKQLPYTIEDIS
jgi:hypothetical protein